MKKLLNGIVEFRRKMQPSHRERFARLALGQSPDTLLITCSDSRVAPNVFASTDPGDLFVVRNVGNMIPPCGGHGISVADESEVAALEFAILNLKVKDIVVCGHSECGAMIALYHGRENVTLPHLRSWLVHGQDAADRLESGEKFATHLLPHNELSQLNVLEQVNHLKTYPLVQERLASGDIKIHGWWFDIAKAELSSYDASLQMFVEIDEREAIKIMEREGTFGVP
jgi:carbonic anhydrase